MASALRQPALLLEQGLQGQTNTAGASITPDLWNDFRQSLRGRDVRQSLPCGRRVPLAVSATLGLHLINAQSHDDRATGALEPDEAITVLGADLRTHCMGRYGHFYAAFASYEGDTACADGEPDHQRPQHAGGPGLENDYSSAPVIPQVAMAPAVSPPWAASTI